MFNWFKHAQLYRLLDDDILPLADLQQHLQQFAYRRLGDNEARRLSFGAPAGRGYQTLAHEVQGHRLMTVIRQERLLPTAVIKEELDDRVADTERQQGRPLGRREKQALKEQITEQLLPQAFVRTRRIELSVDTKRRLIVINAASAKLAEEVLDLLREALGSLKVVTVSVKTPANRTMTNWLKDETTRPSWMLVGEQAVLKARGDDSVVTARQTDLSGDEVRNMLDCSRSVSQLALTIEGVMSLVLNEDLTLKGIRFSDEVLEESHATEDDGDAILRLETDFAIMAEALTQGVEKLMQGLGGEAEPPLGVDGQFSHDNSLIDGVAVIAACA